MKYTLLCGKIMMRRICMFNYNKIIEEVNKLEYVDNIKIILESVDIIFTTKFDNE